MANDNSSGSRTPFSNMADALYRGAQNGGSSAQNGQQSSTNAQTGANPGDANAGDTDRFARLFETLEKDPNNGYNKDFDKRHPHLENVTPELRPFLREVIMRQELKGWTPKIQGTIRTEEEERRHMANGKWQCER